MENSRLPCPIQVAVRYRHYPQYHQSPPFSLIEPNDSFEESSFNPNQLNRSILPNIFSPNVSTQSIYDSIGAPLIEQFIQGFPATILIIGPCGSGKSYTLEGNKINDGFIQMAGKQILLVKESLDLEVCVGFVEIYNEKIYDLLSTLSEGSQQVIPLSNSTSHPDKGFEIKGQTQIKVSSVEDINELLLKGSLNKQADFTKMNMASGRQHSIFSIFLRKRNSNARFNELQFFDLVGKQRNVHVDPKHVKSISLNNKGLSSLERVIQELSSSSSKAHIPYRESKLTMLLQKSLEGDSKTLILATLFNLEKQDSYAVNVINLSQQATKLNTRPILNNQS